MDFIFNSIECIKRENNLYIKKYKYQSIYIFIVSNF
jgi:hypothetical protein